MRAHREPAQPSSAGQPLSGRPLVAGSASGKVIALEEPLSLWGGFDAKSGLIIDRVHPQFGESLTRRVVVMASGRGSSSTSTVLAEAIRLGTAPAAILLRQSDGILALGAIVAEELYGVVLPMVLVDRATFNTVAASDVAEISATGAIIVHPPIAPTDAPKM